MDEEKKLPCFCYLGTRYPISPFFPLDVNLRKEKPTPHKSAALW